MRIEEILRSRREEILRIAARHGVRNVRVFGSVARGETRADSDVDFLVELDEGHTLFDLGSMLVDLEEVLGQKVDLVTEGGLHWYIRDKVIREAVPL